jgi:phosphatidylserine decarboxylase
MLVGTLVLGGAVALLAWVWWPLAFLPLPLLIWLFAFFRDPNRPISTAPGIMVSPADGTVSDITRIDHDELLGGPAVRVGIFLSVFNVHINRSPCAARVIEVIYKKGRFVNAMRHSEASMHNESNTLVLAEPDGSQPIAAVRQISGAIARRIVCTAGIGTRLLRGQRIGLIKFGSRTELSIPTWLEPTILVQIGQSVRGAADVIARLGHSDAAVTTGHAAPPSLQAEASP